MFGSICRASCGSVVYTSLSQWWFISTPQSGQIIVLSVLATTAILCLRRSVQRYQLTTLTKRLRHPDKFFQKLIDTPYVGVIEESAIICKYLLYAREIYIPENRNQPDLTHHRQQIFNDPSSAEWPCRNSYDSDRLMNIFFEATVQDMLQQAGVAVVVFWRHEYQRVCLAHFGREVGLLNRFARVVRG